MPTIKVPTEREATESAPLLREELTTQERILLTQLTHMPGFKVLVKLLQAACARFNDNVIKLDPEAPDYDTKISKRQLKAWVASKFSADVFKAIDWHTDQVILAEQENQEESVDAVAKVFGIHTIGPKKNLLVQPKRKVSATPTSEGKQ